MLFKQIEMLVAGHGLDLNPARGKGEAARCGPSRTLSGDDPRAFGAPLERYAEVPESILGAHATESGRSRT